MPFVASFCLYRPFSLWHSRKAQSLRLFYMALEHLPSHYGAVDIALGIDTYSFSAGMIGDGGFGVFDESCDFAVLRTADANAFLDTHQLVRSGIGSGLRVRDVDRVVFSNEDPTGPAELVPLTEVFSVLVEDLNPVVLTVADKQPPA